MRVQVIIGFVVALLMAHACPAQAPVTSKQAEKAPPPLEPKEMSLAPMPLPVPVLKYRLLPSSATLTPGDAAPIYLRLVAEMSPEAIKELKKKELVEWLDLPLDKIPIAEARKFLEIWKGKLEQIGFGARRETCNWNYTLAEQSENAISILLPDAQESRTWARILQLKARVEIVERKYDDALNTIETGIAFGRHVGEGPFIINSLVGIAIVTTMLNRLDELVSRPDAPNLYWALSNLPQPLVSLRKAMDNEEQLIVRMIPELTQIEGTKTDAEWTSLLIRLHARLVRVQKLVADGNLTPPKPIDLSFTSFKASLLPEAKEYARKTQKLSDEQITAMPEEQLVAEYIQSEYRKYWDNVFKSAQLPYSEARPFFKENEEFFARSKKGHLALFVELQPAVGAALLAQAKLDAKLNILRIFEALRLHGAEHDGKLPDSLDQIKSVPIPLNPMTGKPFEYRKDGDDYLLIGESPVGKRLVIDYRIKPKR